MDYKLISLYLATSFFICLWTIVVTKGVKSYGKTIYSFHILSVILWTFGLAMFYQNTNPKWVLFWTNVLYLGGSLIPATFLHFSYTLQTGVISIPRYKQFIIYIPNIIIFLLLFFTPIIVKDVAIYPGNKTFIYGPGHILWDILFDILFFVAIWRFFRIYRKNLGIQRMRLKYILLGTSIALLLAGTTNVIMPWFRCDFIWLGPCFTLVWLVCVVYAITQYHLMDITLFMREGLVYLPYFLIVSSAFIPLLILIRKFIWAIAFIGMGQIIAAPFIYNRLRKRIRFVVDEVIFGGKFTYLAILEKFIEKIVLIPKEEDLFVNIVRTLVETLAIEKVAIFTLDPIMNDYVLKVQNGLDEIGEIRIKGKSEIAAWMKKHKGVFVKEEVDKILSEEDLQSINEVTEKLGISIYIPAMLENDLLGFIAIGQKISGGMYTHIDLELLERLGVQLAVALDYKRVESQLRKEQELASIGIMSMEIGHELRNLLQLPQTYIDLSFEKRSDDDFYRDFRNMAMDRMKVIRDKLNDIMYLGKERPLDLAAEVEINSLLDENLTANDFSIKKENIEIVKEYSKVPLISADKSQLTYLFNNLILNAIDAMKNRGGKLRIRSAVNTNNVTREMKDKANEWVRIEVKDDGTGIPELVMKRLFTPFVTTKSLGHIEKSGTGLGLSVVKKVVDAHKGYIHVHTKEGKGTTFVVDLPIELKASYVPVPPKSVGEPWDYKE